MNITLIIVCAGLSGCLGLFASIPVRSSHMVKKAGLCIVPVHEKGKRIAVLFIFCPLLVVLLLIRNLDVYVQIIICGVALLGIEITVREYLSSRFGGVYEKAIIGGGHFIPYNDILSLPVLSLPKSERGKYDICSLYIATKSHGILKIHYADFEMCNTVTKAVLAQEKRLKQ